MSSPIRRRSLRIWSTHLRLAPLFEPLHMASGPTFRRRIVSSGSSPARLSAIGPMHVQSTLERLGGGISWRAFGAYSSRERVSEMRLAGPIVTERLTDGPVPELLYPSAGICAARRRSAPQRGRARRARAVRILRAHRTRRRSASTSPATAHAPVIPSPDASANWWPAFRRVSGTTLAGRRLRDGAGRASPPTLAIKFEISERLLFERRAPVRASHRGSGRRGARRVMARPLPARFGSMGADGVATASPCFRGSADTDTHCRCAGWRSVIRPRPWRPCTDGSRQAAFGHRSQARSDRSSRASDQGPAAIRPFSTIESGLERPRFDELIVGVESRRGASTVIRLAGVGRWEQQNVALTNPGVPDTSYSIISVPDGGIAGS